MAKKLTKTEKTENLYWRMSAGGGQKEYDAYTKYLAKREARQSRNKKKAR